MAPSLPRLRAAAALVALPLALAVFPGSQEAGAQEARGTVTGRVTDGNTGAPISAVFVALENARGEVVATRLTDGNGRFALQGPAGAGYSVRAERIGLNIPGREGFDLAPGPAVSHDLVAWTQAVTLEGIRVEADARCALPAEAGSEVVRVWDAVRAALQVAAEGGRSGGFRFQLRSWERQATPDGRRTIQEDSRASALWARTPFVSAPASDLMEEGWIRPAGRSGDWIIHAPDAGTLTSNLFLERHCFELASAPDDEGMVGLAFRPVRPGRGAAIQGVLWVHAASARLSHITFGFVGDHPWLAPGVRLPDDLPGGRVEFVELPDGSWAVSRWFIQAPVLGSARQAAPVATQGRAVLSGRYEVGGEVMELRGLGGVTISLQELGSVEGVVAGGSGAVVRLAGTPYRTRTDPLGRFALGPIPPGRYTLQAVHPILDELVEAGFAEAEVEIPAGGSAEARLRLPTLPEVASAVCTEEAPSSADAAPSSADAAPVPPLLVVGMVALPPGSGQVEALEVSITRRRYNVQDLGWLRERWEQLIVQPDPRGRFQLCASFLPDFEAVLVDWTLEVRTPDGGILATTQLEGGPGSVVVERVVVR